MSEMVERAAKAAYEARRAGETINPHIRWATWDELPPAALVTEFAAARAAIEAMREPTGGMVDALPSRMLGDELSAPESWALMIEAALAP